MDTPLGSFMYCKFEYNSITFSDSMAGKFILLSFDFTSFQEDGKTFLLSSCYFKALIFLQM